MQPQCRQGRGTERRAVVRVQVVSHRVRSNQAALCESRARTHEPAHHENSPNALRFQTSPHVQQDPRTLEPPPDKRHSSTACQKGWDRATARGSDAESRKGLHMDVPRPSRRAVLIAAGIALWLYLCRVASQTDPAAVQLLLALTAAVLIATNMGTRSRAAGELSAYSVFNPNHMPLLGQLRAEQFDQEIRHRPT